MTSKVALGSKSGVDNWTGLNTRPYSKDGQLDIAKENIGVQNLISVPNPVQNFVSLEANFLTKRKFLDMSKFRGKGITFYPRRY